MRTDKKPTNCLPEISGRGSLGGWERVCRPCTRSLPVALQSFIAWLHSLTTQHRRVVSGSRAGMELSWYCACSEYTPSPFTATTLLYRQYLV